MNVQNAVWTAGERHALFPRGTTLVLGVSGGADSLALLHALAALRRRLGLTLIAATLDHGLRGRDGAADAAHVDALAEAWHVPVVVGTADVAALAVQQRAGIEEAARNARYAFLAEVARSHGAGRIAVGHHADDQAETVLMHLLRGAGLDGLGGMRPLAPVPGAPDLMLVRPLLGVTRAQIAAYCARHDIAARDDATNADTALTRGWLRHELLPLMHSR
ncbi:MAG TPA: tRNA lysidine(34) synthetase TilS, partial [Candidatus Limnocylindrales bacterium]|nr:tRNA lysidine(34) synthetase TilS [Candidatus Limnocylindrales bacterium]